MGIPIAIGDRKGLVTIVEKVGRSQWACHCDCGADVILSTQQWASRKSCGCLAKIKKDMIGVRKGRLVAIAPAPAKKGVRYWVCRCDCGKEVLVCTNELGPSSCRRSCGCIQEEVIQNAKKWKPDPRAAAQKRATEERRERKKLEQEKAATSRTEGGILDDNILRT